MSGDLCQEFSQSSNQTINQTSIIEQISFNVLYIIIIKVFKKFKNLNKKNSGVS